MTSTLHRYTKLVALFMFFFAAKTQAQNGPAPTSFTNKTRTDGLGNNQVLGLYAIGSTVYAATSGGLSISTNGGGSFNNYTTINGLGGGVFGVYATTDSLYAATPGGLSISTNGGSTFTNYTKGLGSANVVGVFAIGSTVYAATSKGLSISTNGGSTFTNHNRANSGLGNNVVQGVYAIDSTVYVATQGCLSISTNGGSSFTNLTITNGLGSNYVFGVYAIGSTVYAATTGGLSISTNGGSSFTNYTTTNGLGNNVVRGVYAIGSTVYAATDLGLSISTNGGVSFNNYTTTNGLGNNQVWGVFAIGNTVYAATNGGVSYGSVNTAPTFTNSNPQVLAVCQSSGATSINSLLTISDEDAGQTETWSISTSPSHGTLLGFNTTASSGNTSIVPSGLIYTPTVGYSGSDQFVVQVSDGTSSNTQTINVNVKQSTTDTVTAVSTASYTWHDNTYTASGYYTFDSTNVAGCDSLTTLNLTITNLPAPTITSFTPTSTCPGSTATVTVFGSNFTGATSVTIGGTPASYFTVDSASTLKVVVPANATGNLVVTAVGGSATSAGAFSNSSLVIANAYVANSASGTVSVINTATNVVTKTLTVGANPYAVTLIPSGNFAYITNGNSNSVSIINTTTNTVTGTIAVGTNPYGITTSPDGTKVYVTNNGSNTVNVINTATNTVTATIPVGINPFGVIVSPDNSKLYVVNGTGNTVSVINTATNTVTATVPVGTNPRRISITPDGTRLYVSNSVSNNVSVINTATNTVTATVPVGTAPLGITVSLDGEKIYVANATNASISVINTATNTVVSTIPVGNTPYGVSLSPDGTKLFVVNSGSNSVSVISAATNTVTATVPVGNAPFSIGNFVANVLSPCALLTNTWTGAISTDWFNSGNWTIGVPTATTDGIIPTTAANQPVIGSGTAVVDNIIVETGAKLTNNATLNVYGNFADTGRFISGAGSQVLLLGGSRTIIGTDTFVNLEIKGNYSVGASTTDKIYVTQILKKTSGTLTTNNKLTLISNASGTGLIEENGGSLSGKAYIQHYAGGNFGYHEFSSPISDGTVNSWSNAFPIFGPDGAPGWSTNWGSLQVYDEVDNGFSRLDSGYYNYTATSNPLTPGQGFSAWLNSLPTLNTFGTPNNGSIGFPVTHSAGINAPRGWNLVGNPYPSPISWTALKALNPGLFGDASCYLWKASGVGTSGTWTAYDGTVGVNGAGDVINSSLGFFVYVNNSGTLNFDNTVRTYSYTNPEIFGAKSTAASTLRISIKDEAARTTDEAVAYTSNQAGFSRKMAQPATATNATIAFDVNGTKAAINTLTAIDSKTELPITVLTPRAGTYTVSLSTKNINLPVYLKDAVTGTYTDLSSSTTITTTSKETSGRYSLVFAPLTTYDSRLTTITAYPNPAKSNVEISGTHIASVQIVDNLGRVVKTVSLTDATNPALSLSSLPAGAYHLRVQTTDGKVNNIGMVKE